MYKILGPDRKEYGPASAEQIHQWIREGRVSSQTQIQSAGSSEWKSASEFPEFSEALLAKARSPVPSSPGAPTSTPPPMPSQRPPSNGLAVASLVFGILSFIGCTIFAGIPAIIMGHIAHSRARRAPQQFGGAGLATTGFVLGYLSLAFLPILAGLLLPALAKAKAKAQQINCVQHMKQIGLAARLWSNAHNDKFPPDFLSMSNELASPNILVCPGDSSKSRAQDWSQFGPQNVSYQFLRPGIDEKDAAQTVVFQCPIHGNVGLGDGSVQQGQRTRRIK